MVSKVMLMKTKWYPRPHNYQVLFGLGLESATANDDTIVPISIYDEAQGDPALYNANPEHASFAEYGGPNCYPDSRINILTVDCQIILTKGAIQTDKVVGVKYYYQPIFTTFDDIIANDEVSGLDIGEILELQREATDRQSYPLYNAADMATGVGAAVTVMHADVPGLT